MPAARVAMRKIKEVLRLHHACGLSKRKRCGDGTYQRWLRSALLVILLGIMRCLSLTVDVTLRSRRFAVSR